MYGTHFQVLDAPIGSITSSRKTSGNGFLNRVSNESEKPVDANVVVLVVFAGILDVARLHLSPPERLLPDEVGVLAPQLPFPLGFLLQVVAPGDHPVVDRFVSAVLDQIRDRIVEAWNESGLQGDGGDRRQHALRHAVGRIGPQRVAELRDDVAVSDDEPVGAGALGRNRAEQLAIGDFLIGKVPSRGARLVGLHELDGVVQLRRVHADLGSGPVRPLPGRRVIRGFRLRERHAEQAQCQSNDDAFAHASLQTAVPESLRESTRFGVARRRLDLSARRLSQACW